MIKINFLFSCKNYHSFEKIQVNIGNKRFFFQNKLLKKSLGKVFFFFKQNLGKLNLQILEYLIFFNQIFLYLIEIGLK